MKVHWNQLAFTHSCGLSGTILEVCVSRDGGLLISGCCAVCGQEFSIEDTTSNLIAKAAVRDYMKHKAITSQEVLADFIPVGKPN